MNKKCKHNYDAGVGVGNPESYYNYMIVQICLSCGKKKERYATYEECQNELKKRTCDLCGLNVFPDTHLDHLACIKSLSEKIINLEFKIKSLEDWRNS